MEINGIGMLERPEMTFLIPVKNIERYFYSMRANLESNLNIGDEIVVVNDCSSDKTDELLAAWAKVNNQVVVIDNRGKPGLVSALNQGIQIASKKWIARFDADDDYSSDRISKQMQSVQSDTVAVFCDYSFIGQNSENLGTIPSPIFPVQTSVSLIQGVRTPHPSAIFLREAVIEAGMYEEDELLAEDLGLWLRMSRIGALRSTPYKLLSYRLNPGSLMGKSQELARAQQKQVLKKIGINSNDVNYFKDNIEECLDLYDKYSDINLRRLLALRDLKMALIYLEIESKNISHYFLKEIVLSPNSLKSIGNLYFEKKRRADYRNTKFIAKN